MQRMITLLALILYFLSYTLYGQEQKPTTLYNFRLYEGFSGEQELTRWLLEAEMHTLFYMYEEDSLLMMANASFKADHQSYGPVTHTKDSEFGTDAEGYEVEIHYFDWQYVNDYDDETGMAKVKAIITTKPDGLYLRLIIVPNDLQIILYYGVMQDQPDI